MFWRHFTSCGTRTGGTASRPGLGTACLGYDAARLGYIRCITSPRRIWPTPMIRSPPRFLRNDLSRQGSNQLERKHRWTRREISRCHLAPGTPCSHSFRFDLCRGRFRNLGDKRSSKLTRLLSLRGTSFRDTCSCSFTFGVGGTDVVGCVEQSTTHEACFYILERYTTPVGYRNYRTRSVTRLSSNTVQQRIMLKLDDKKEDRSPTITLKPVFAASHRHAVRTTKIYLVSW